MIKKLKSTAEAEWRRLTELGVINEAFCIADEFEGQLVLFPYSV